MSFTAPGIKGVVTDVMDVPPIATVVFQAVSALDREKWESTRKMPTFIHEEAYGRKRRF